MPRVPRRERLIAYYNFNYIQGVIQFPINPILYGQLVNTAKINPDRVTDPDEFIL